MFNFPWTNFHELNLDWILSVVKEAKEVFDNGRSDIDYAVETADEAKEIATQAAEASIADNSVSTVKIQNGAVTNAKLANNSVTTANIVDRTIIGNDIAENTIESYNIKNGTIISADIGSGEIKTANIADANVTYAKLAANAKNIHNAQYCRFPDGLIVQWGRGEILANELYTSVTFPVPFSDANYGFASIPEYDASGTNITSVYGAKSASGINLYTSTTHNASQFISWIAIGYA